VDDECGRCGARTVAGQCAEGCRPVLNKASMVGRVRTTGAHSSARTPAQRRDWLAKTVTGELQKAVAAMTDDQIREVTDDEVMRRVQKAQRYLDLAASAPAELRQAYRDQAAKAMHPKTGKATAKAPAAKAAANPVEALVIKAQVRQLLDQAAACDDPQLREGYKLRAAKMLRKIDGGE